ncbi:MAG: flippase activity-associated protein Agl23 [Dehalococcoidia bacterium]
MIASPPVPPEESFGTRLLSRRVSLNLELGFYALVFAAATVLRFWALGDRAYHHDESIHAQWSWDLLNGVYRHSPVFHGPFYYNVQALTFLVTGVSDYTGRVSPALFGLALTATPLLLRRQLGAVGTAAAVAFLAFSPTVVYFSRFLREDIYVAVFISLMVVGIVRYMDEGRQRWLGLLALSFTGAVLTKEGAFITTGLFLIYLDLQLSGELAEEIMRRRPGDPSRAAAVLEGIFWTTVLAPIAWVIAGLWPFLGRLRARLTSDGQLPRSGEVLLVLGTLTLPLLTPGSRHYVFERFGLIDADRLSWNDSLRTGVSGADAMALGGLFAFTLSISVFAGLNWRPRLWALLFLPSAVIYLTLMTTYWTNVDGLVSGPWGSLDYWIEQQNEFRGDQPWFYYYMVMPAYEFLPLVIALGAAWWALFHGSALSRLLLFWGAGQWLALSYAAEKMPWNNTHIAVPICLLAAWGVQRAWDAGLRRRGGEGLVLSLAGIAALSAGVSLLVAWPPGPLETMGARLGLASAGALVAVFSIWPLGRERVPLALIAVAVGALGFLSLRAMYGASFVRADDPRDLLIYTQSSGELATIARDINRLAEASGEGLDLKIAVDSTDSFAWPWAWYLRDYRNVAYPNMSAEDLSLVDYDVILVNTANISQVNAALGGDPTAVFAEPDRYPHRWWFDERYKAAFDLGNGACTAQFGSCGPWRPATWKRLFSRVFDGSWPRYWLSYLRDHEPSYPNGSVDAYALFPAGFDRETGVFEPVVLPPSGPTTDAEGRLSVGTWGTGAGRFLEPSDAAVGPDGSVYVVDRASEQLQRFDAAGNFIALVDVGEGDPGHAVTDPWGVGVGPSGEVIVADTFGYRLRVFSADLTPIVAFGQAPDVEREPGPFDLYGPRDVAFDTQGNMWVTDTGNDRIVVYTPAGEFVRTVGVSGSGPGQLDEPVGIAMDGSGTVFVADMWNGRVQMFSEDGSPAGSFKVEGWGGQDALDKPYLAVLADGRLAVSLPLAGEVRIYNRTGELASLLDAGSEGLDHPYGLATRADGRLWVVEGGRRRLRLFEIP